jgi:hypothetical protein
MGIFLQTLLSAVPTTISAECGKAKEASLEPVIPQSCTDEKASAPLHVSTDLRILCVTEGVQTDSEDIVREGTTYRKLSPEYFAWLSLQMQKAATAFDNGRLPSDAWKELYDRFVNLNVEAVKVLGEKFKLPIGSSFDASRYNPPRKQKPQEIFSSWVYPARPVFGDNELIQPVTQAAVDAVKAISEHALSCGWSESQLYQNRGRYRFPCGQDYGLVCYVDTELGKRTIGRVTERFIELIVNPDRKPAEALYFFNRNSNQPWIKSERIAS